MAYALSDFAKNLIMKEFKPDPARSLHETDHLVPHANRLLRTAGRMAWGMVKLFGWVAVRIPGLFVRANGKNIERWKAGKQERGNDQTLSV